MTLLYASNLIPCYRDPPICCSLAATKFDTAVALHIFDTFKEEQICVTAKYSCKDKSAHTHLRYLCATDRWIQDCSACASVTAKIWTHAIQFNHSIYQFHSMLRCRKCPYTFERSLRSRRGSQWLSVATYILHEHAQRDDDP